MDKLANDGCKQVLVAPIGFLCDHVETLYDIDIELKRFAAGRGLQLERITMLNDSAAPHRDAEPLCSLHTNPPSVLHREQPPHCRRHRWRGSPVSRLPTPFTNGAAAAGIPIRCTVVDSAPVWGGKIVTHRVGDLVDGGRTRLFPVPETGRP